MRDEKFANLRFDILVFILTPSPFNVAERVGFEPTVRFPVHSISSAASSATPAPLPIADCGIRIAD